MTRYLLDTTVLVAHLRDDDAIRSLLRRLLAAGHTTGTSCVNVAEIERGIRPKERKRVEALLERLGYFPTTREAARRAGQYQARFAARGRTLDLADAIIAGTARANGAVLVTHNVKDFPMADLRVVNPGAL